MTHDEIQQMISRNDQSEIRAHGWAVLTSLLSKDPQGENGNSGYVADWDRLNGQWENKCTLGLGGNSSRCRIVNNSDCPLPKPQNATRFATFMEVPTQQIDFTKLHSNAPQAPALPAPSALAFISSIRFNPKASDFIRRHCLHQAQGIESLARESEQNRQFDNTSVIVKLIWATPDPRHQVSVWNPAFAKRKNDGDSVLPNVDQWQRVKVDVNDPSPCSVSSHPGFKTFAPDRPPTTDSTVPINCFYHRYYPCELLDGGLAPSSVGQVNHCRHGKFFYALLMGVHIITAEQHDWVWSTYWWTPNPKEDTRHDDQPPSVAQYGPWWFYAMNTTMSPTVPLEEDGSPHIAFNPYIEGPNHNATSSNCMYCHQMAVMRPGSSKITAEQAIRSGSPPPCAYKHPLPTGCPLTDILPYNDAYRRDATATHFLWSVADNQDPERRKNTSLIEMLHKTPMRRP
ncbi:hypothetical protein FTW19_02950 [Terriglobus albidus]|uniref:Uncharacterized protein n=1 Tax=Terriglobus albidus TaxID=1592106 RepID=A0A5B9E5J1_9BACT|nr:hypothetical protein [Terriglobus albidus]QEE27059.1 hypothetical protein FTW19_02950 [Terriglobus albidus]